VSSSTPAASGHDGTLEEDPLYKKDPWAQGQQQETTTGTWDNAGWQSAYKRPQKYFDKEPPPAWGGKHPETTWGDYRRQLDHWLASTDIPSTKHGFLLWKVLTGNAKLLIEHLSDGELAKYDAGGTIRSIQEKKAFRHISDNEDQDDFDRAVFGLHRDRNQSILDFSNVALSAFLKADAHGDPLPDKRKGMIFLRAAKIPGHLEDHLMTRTAGSRNFSDLIEAVRVLARRPGVTSSNTYVELGDSDYVQEDEDEGQEDYLDYDSDGGNYIPLDKDDLAQVYEEDDAQWALASFQQNRDAQKGRLRSGKGSPSAASSDSKRHK
jgi:hypothetical protein